MPNTLVMLVESHIEREKRLVHTNLVCLLNQPTRRPMLDAFRTLNWEQIRKELEEIWSFVKN